MNNLWKRLNEWSHKMCLEKVSETVYLLYFGLITLMAFKSTTMIDQIVFSDHFYHMVYVMGLLVVLFRLVTTERWNLTSILFSVILCIAISRTNFRAFQERYLVSLAILIVGAKGIEFRKIAITHVTVCSVALVITMVLALSGRIENLIYLRDGKRRISFGIGYPTDFAAHLFFICSTYAWIRYTKLSYIELIFFIAISFFCYYYCDARNTTICLILLCLELLYIKIQRKRNKMQNRSYQMNNFVALLCVWSAPIGAIIMIGLSYLYNSSSKFLSRIDSTLSGRLRIGRIAFDNFSLSLFGQFVPMQGNGGSILPKDNYFWLDSSYVSILFRFGVILLALVLGILVYASYREKKNGAWEKLGILAVVVIHCMIEHHLIEIAHVPFLLLALATSKER